MFFAHALLAVLSVLAMHSLHIHPQTLRKIPITCDAGAFLAGEHASVTCNFHKEMTADKRGINVVRFPLNATDNELDVLACEWKEILKKYHCIVKKGYTFDNDITDRLTVVIPTVSEGYKGLYFCFIVPSEETDKHGCELKIKVSTGLYSTTPPSRPIPEGKEDTNSHIWIPVLVILTLGVITVVVFVIWKRRNSKKKKQQNEQDIQQSKSMLPQTEQSTPHRTANPTSQSDACKKRVKTVMKGFKLAVLDCERVCKLLRREMDPSASTNSKTSTCVRSLPKGTETGDFLSVGLGIDGVDIERVRLSGAETDVQSEVYDLRTDSTADEAIQTEETDSMSFFSLVAEAVKQFLKKHHLSEKAIPAEFVFCASSGLDGDVTFDHLTKYTKGYFCEDDADKDATESLQNMLRKINATRRVKIKPTIMDPVGTLLSGIHNNQACKAAFLSDAELTACYVPQQMTVQKEVEITTIEMGAIGDTGCLDVFRTDFDIALDKCSENPGEKILGKMISWRHLGEIVRLVLMELVEKGLLSMSVPASSALRKTGGFTSRHFLLIDSDVDGHTAMTEFILDELQVQNHTTEDCNIAKDVCKTIFERSACLTAAALAALITFLDQSEVSIAIDGCLYQDHLQFQQTVQNKTKELVKEDLKEFKLLLQHNGRRVGAAVAAVLSTPPIQTKEASASEERKSTRQKKARRRKTNPEKLASKQMLVK